jgi:hypothetical protein
VVNIDGNTNRCIFGKNHLKWNIKYSNVNYVTNTHTLGNNTDTLVNINYQKYTHIPLLGEIHETQQNHFVFNFK